MLLSGIRSMSALPDLIFLVDVHREATAIHEANLLHIPVIAMVDTNCDPSNVDYIIPSNDDAIRAIKLVVGKIADAAVEGRAMRKDEIEEDTSARAAARMVEEQELSDEELLGEATLAKLSSRGRESEEEVEEEADAFEEFEDEILDEEEEEMDEFLADKDEDEDEDKDEPALDE
jgi:small subunit ribosomal protein S2